MRRPHRQIEVFDISLMAVVTKAMGAFLVLMLILIPYYPTGPNVEQTVEDAQSKVEDAKANVKEATKAAEAGNIEELKRQLEELERKLSEIEAELRILQARFTQAKEENARLEAENKRLEDELTPLRAENESLKTENERLKAELEDLKSELARVVAERDQARAEAETLRAENERLKAENERLRQEAERRGAAVEDLRALVEQLKREVAARDNEIARLDREVAARGSRIVQLEQDLAAHQALLMRQQQQIAALTDENARLKQELARAQETIRRLEVLVEELQRRSPTQTLPLFVHLTWKDCPISNLDLLVVALRQNEQADGTALGSVGPFVLPWAPYNPVPAEGQRFDAKDDSPMPGGIPIVETMAVHNAKPGARYAVFAKLVVPKENYPSFIERSTKLLEEWQKTVTTGQTYRGMPPGFPCFPSWFVTNARTVISPSSTHRVDIRNPVALIGEITVLPTGALSVRIRSETDAATSQFVKHFMCMDAPNLCPKL